MKLSTWDGGSIYDLGEDVWLEVIGQLMLGHHGKIELKGTALLSDRGWSAYVNTFGDADPSSLGTCNRGRP